VYSQGPTGQAGLYQYLPALAPDPNAPPYILEEQKDPRFTDARFPILRRLELIQRAYASGRLEHAYQNAMDLLNVKMMDPMAGSLGAYILLNLGRPQDMAACIYNLVNFFPGLPDTHILTGAHHEYQGDPAAAREAYQSALDAGLPIFRDGLKLLISAADRLQIQHPALAQVQAAADQALGGLVWAAFTFPRLQAGQPLRLG
jgi:hypothetical protein